MVFVGVFVCKLHNIKSCQFWPQTLGDILPIVANRNDREGFQDRQNRWTLPISRISRTMSQDSKYMKAVHHIPHADSSQLLFQLFSAGDLILYALLTIYCSNDEIYWDVLLHIPIQPRLMVLMDDGRQTYITQVAHSHVFSPEWPAWCPSAHLFLLEMFAHE